MINNMAVVRRWGEQWGYIGRGGVIVLFDGEVQSWVNQLRNPEHWQLSCIAFDEEGKIWTTIAGDQCDGALMWLPSDPIPNQRKSPSSTHGRT